MKLFLLFFMSGPFLTVAGKNHVKLEPQIKNSYLKLLEQASGFHKAISQGDQKQIQKKIKETQEIIAKLYKQSSALSEFHFRIHSHKLLTSIEEQLAVISHSSSLKETPQKKVVKKLFNSFFELAQVYDLTKDIKAKMFYCNKDKSLWFQKNKEGKNPINPNYKNCATQIL